MNEHQVRNILNAYAVAVHTKDVDGFVAIYDTDVHVFDAWGQWEMRGADALREMATGWFGSLGDERVIVELNDVTIMAGEDVAWTHAALTFIGESASGERLRSITNRATFCLAKKNGAWKIVHEHTSLPIDMETMQAITTR